MDGTQKLYRDGLLQDPRWCERIVGHPEEKNKQQYIYTIEANITITKWSHDSADDGILAS